MKKLNPKSAARKIATLEKEIKDLTLEKLKIRDQCSHEGTKIISVSVYGCRPDYVCTACGKEFE